jgi:hypothetical protein
VRLFELIDAEKADYSISLLCRVLQVSRKGYTVTVYWWHNECMLKILHRLMSEESAVGSGHDISDYRPSG